MQNVVKVTINMKPTQLEHF